MDRFKFEILTASLLPDYLNIVADDLKNTFLNLTDSAVSTPGFSFYTSVAAVFSSKIEGEQIEIDSFLKHKLTEAKFIPDYTQKTDDLYDAYQFAREKPFTAQNCFFAHGLITRHILIPAQQGVLRSGNMFVITTNGRIEYVACIPQKVKTELNKLLNDISYLFNAELSSKEVFFFASLIHLVFVKIHPFQDGNGRAARLIEKWFMAEKLGEQAWLIQSEKYYYEQHDIYYQNIRRLGLEYDDLTYKEALPFLLMLPQSLYTKHDK